MITDHLTTVNDMPLGDTSLVLVTRNGYDTKLLNGRIVINQRKKYFVTGRASFSGNTVAFKKDEILYSLLLFTVGQNTYQISSTKEIIAKLRKSGQIKEEKISKLGHELVFHDDCMISAVEAMRIVQKEMPDNQIDMQLCFRPIKLKEKSQSPFRPTIIF